MENTAPVMVLDRPIPVDLAVADQLAAETQLDPIVVAAEQRRNHLTSLPQKNFNAEQYANTVDRIVAIGLPVDNITSLHRRANTKGREDVLGSFGIRRHNHAHYSLDELLEHHPPEKAMRTHAHDLSASVAPLARHTP